MPTRLLILLGLLAVWSLAGCPVVTTADGPRIPGATDGQTDGTDLAGSSGSAGASSDSGQNAGTVVDAGTSASLAGGAHDGLSSEFPGCSEPREGAFWRSEVLRLVNVERARVGLGPVVQSDTLEAQATQYACELIHYDFFGHENPSTGSTLADRADEFEYEYWALGENLAAGQPTPEKVVADWMLSVHHRENVLNPAFTELGVGVRLGGDYDIYWVQEFGRPRSAGPYDD